MPNPIAWVKRECPRAWEVVELVTESLPLLAGVAGFAWARAVGPERASEAYYAAAAGVIPVLLLTLAIQERAFSLRRGRGGGAFTAVRRFYELIFLLLLVLGELAALRALADASSREEVKAYDIYGVIAFGLFMLAAIAMLAPAKHEPKEGPA